MNYKRQAKGDKPQGSKNETSCTSESNRLQI